MGTILIHPRTKPPKPTPSSTDIFTQDIKFAFTAYTTALTSRITPTNQVHLAPPPRMLPSGCWCPDASKPSPHNWKTCLRYIPQPIVDDGAQAIECTHSPASNLPEHLFCFDAARAAEDYITWFTHIPGPPEMPLAEDEAAYLGDWLREHYSAGAAACGGGGGAGDMEVDEFPQSEDEAQQHFALLSRVFVEMREEPPNSSRMGGWYDAERVLALLKWREMDVRHCMDAFLPWLRYAKMRRLQGHS